MKNKLILSIQVNACLCDPILAFEEHFAVDSLLGLNLSKSLMYKRAPAPAD